MTDANSPSNGDANNGEMTAMAALMLDKVANPRSSANCGAGAASAGARSCWAVPVVRLVDYRQARRETPDDRG